MADIIDFKDKTKYRIVNQYPALHGSDVPTLYKTKTINTKQKDIKEYDVVLWHRLLRNIYQEPLELEIECELLIKGQTIGTAERVVLRRLEEKSKWQILNVTNVTEETALKIQSKEITLNPINWINWKYFIRLPSGGIVEIGTKDRLTVFYIAYIVRSGQQKNDSDEAKQFISLLLDEANRLRKQLFNPIKEFEKAEGIKSYALSNVYLSNYVSAKFMQKIALSQEENLQAEFLRYDARTELHDQEKSEYIEQYMLACGMYFYSAIMYFFMALEGFINIVFHAFLKKDLRNRDLNIEQRFDIEQKLKLMPALCSGFKEEYVGATSEIYSNFLKLKKYRNSIFHSKVEESLKILAFIEDGFVYRVDLSKYKEQFLPSHKIKLTDRDVLEVKRIVDEIINMVLNSMTESTKDLTEKYILNSSLIPFYVLDDGSLSMGQSKREIKPNEAQQGVQGDRDLK